MFNFTHQIKTDGRTFQIGAEQIAAYQWRGIFFEILSDNPDVILMIARLDDKYFKLRVPRPTLDSAVMAAETGAKAYVRGHLPT